MNLLFITIAVSAATSLCAKFLADSFLSEHISLVGSFAGLTYSLNPGIAFGIQFPLAIQTALITGALLLMCVFAFRTAQSVYAQVGFGMIIGGALGNVLDRMRDGMVTDFFQVGTFPIFNVADSCITIGVIVLLLEMVLFRSRTP